MMPKRYRSAAAAVPGYVQPPSSSSPSQPISTASYSPYVQDLLIGLDEASRKGDLEQTEILLDKYYEVKVLRQREQELRILNSNEDKLVKITALIMPTLPDYSVEEMLPFAKFLASFKNIPASKVIEHVDKNFPSQHYPTFDKEDFKKIVKSAPVYPSYMNGKAEDIPAEQVVTVHRGIRNSILQQLKEDFTPPRIEDKLMKKYGEPFTGYKEIKDYMKDDYFNRENKAILVCIIVLVTWALFALYGRVYEHHRRDPDYAHFNIHNKQYPWGTQTLFHYLFPDLDQHGHEEHGSHDAAEGHHDDGHHH